MRGTLISIAVAVAFWSVRYLANRRKGSPRVATVQTPWRRSPFEPGRRYRVRRDFQSARDAFRSGELLVYERDVRSRYDGMTGYLFRTPGQPSVRVWDLPDRDDLEIWRDLFEKV